MRLSSRQQGRYHGWMLQEWTLSGLSKVTSSAVSFSRSFRQSSDAFLPSEVMAADLPQRMRIKLGLTDGSELVQFRMRVCPMGWSWAVHFVQLASMPACSVSHASVSIPHPT